MDDERKNQRPNETDHSDLIRQEWDVYRQQQENAADYETGKNVRRAVRDYEDAAPGYREAYGRETRDMYRAMDNAALTARTAGEYGGMATERVREAGSGYLQRRQELSLEQERLATDTLQAVASLRAAGEFDKADAALKAGQGELRALYEEAVRLDDNRWSNDKYDDARRREEEKLTREDASILREEDETRRQYLQRLGQTFLNAGVMPSEEMLEAMNLSREMARSYVNAVLNGY